MFKISSLSNMTSFRIFWKRLLKTCADNCIKYNGTNFKINRNGFNNDAVVNVVWSRYRSSCTTDSQNIIVHKITLKLQSNDSSRSTKMAPIYDITNQFLTVYNKLYLITVATAQSLQRIMEHGQFCFWFF